MNKNTEEKIVPIRLITAGSVDDGKSTLIGRLLFDCKAVLSDQILTVAKAKHARVQAHDAKFDLSLLTDGLASEREQGITIDVAYRYFATANRKFILADAPGHEQYTRNLVTGASQSDVAIILVDATKIDKDSSPVNLLAQTKRHSTIIKLLNLHYVVFAVNKMDLVGYDEKHFRVIEEAIFKFSEKIGLATPKVIPVSALKGEGIAFANKNMPWYKGNTVLSWLEGLQINPDEANTPLRMPVQLVYRQDGDSLDNFRGYLGKVEAGTVNVGQKINLLPSQTQSTIKTIYKINAKDSCQQAVAGEAVTIELSDNLDISRGELIVDEHQPNLTKNIRADICWLDSQALTTKRKYLLRMHSKVVGCKINKINKVLDIQTLEHEADHKGILVNDIGEVEISLQSPLAVEDYNTCKTTGAFILIDPVGQQTVAAGMIRE